MSLFIFLRMSEYFMLCVHGLAPKLFQFRVIVNNAAMTLLVREAFLPILRAVSLGDSRAGGLTGAKGYKV